MAFTPGHLGFHPWEDSSLALNGGWSPADEGLAALPSQGSGLWPLAGLPSPEQAGGPQPWLPRLPYPIVALYATESLFPGRGVVGGEVQRALSLPIQGDTFNHKA